MLGSAYKMHHGGPPWRWGRKSAALKLGCGAPHKDVAPLSPAPKATASPGHTHARPLTIGQLDRLPRWGRRREVLHRGQPNQTPRATLEGDVPHRSFQRALQTSAAGGFIPLWPFRAELERERLLRSLKGYEVPSEWERKLVNWSIAYMYIELEIEDINVSTLVRPSAGPARPPVLLGWVETGPRPT